MALFILFSSHYYIRRYGSSVYLKYGGYFLAVLNITFTLFLPIILMIRRARVSAIMPMPKASINKYGYFLLWKYKIRMPLYGIVSPPTGNVVFFEHFN